MEESRAPESIPLRRAATGVFALVAVLPLLLFAYTVYEVGALARGVVQVMLGLALGLVLVGSYIFRLLVDRVSEIMRAPAAAEDMPMAETAGAPRTFALPGFGTIKEPEPIRESVMMPAAVEQLRMIWAAEAEPLVGQRVLVAVRNAPDPIAGTLLQVTGDGLLLQDEGGRRVGVSYRRISGVEAAPS